MTTDLLRRYIDIIEESNYGPEQLEEGLLDTVKAKVAQIAARVFSPQDMEAMKQAVERATGKSIDQVSIRDLGGRTAMTIASALGVKPAAGGAVTESQLNELFGIKSDQIKYWEKDSAAKGYPLSPDQVKRQMDYDDFQKYGFTTGQLVKRIVGFGSQLTGLAGIVGTVMGNVNPLVGGIALIAFLVGSLVARSGYK